MPPAARTTFILWKMIFAFGRMSKGRRIASIDIDSGSTISGRLSGLGFFVENEDGPGLQGCGCAVLPYPGKIFSPGTWA